MLGQNRYGKSGIRVARLSRHAGRHDFKDVTVAIACEGDFEAAHIRGDNAAVLPTDTMKNTVYALAKEKPLEEIESFGLALAEHFLKASPEMACVTVEISERLWKRIDGDAFELPGRERRLAKISGTRQGAAVEAGLDGLLIAKTSKSGFSGFRRDRYTTLKETEDRILATALSAWWSYAEGDLSYGLLWRAVRQTLLETFAAHDSKSVQHTLYAMGEAVLESHDAVSGIHLTMPNKHHLLADLSPFGLENSNEVFVPTEEPYGLIEATVRRSS